MEKLREHARSENVMKLPDDFFRPLSEEEKYHCLEILRYELGADGLDESCCLVCDKLVLRRDLLRKEGSDRNFVDQLCECLGDPNISLPKELRDEYRCAPPPHIAGLENVLVSPRGVHCYVDGDGNPDAWMSICKKCDASIKSKTLPRFAIANGFFIGQLSEHLSALTIPEQFMTQLASVGAITRVMRGGRHRCIRSHCVAFDFTPGPPVTLLPRCIRDIKSYRVILVGDFTEGQLAKVRTMHRVRAPLVRDAFNFYKDYNRLYEHVFPHEDLLNVEHPDNLSGVDFVEQVEDLDGQYEDGINPEQENVRGRSDAWRVPWVDEELAVLERRVGLMDDSSSVDVRNHPLVSNAQDRKFLVRRSTKFSDGLEEDLLPRMFPHLFPFGRGHPGERRRQPVSLKECVKHCISLSTRRFTEDELFVLVAFDLIAARNMYVQNSIRCHRLPQRYSGYESIRPEELGGALLNDERRRHGLLPLSGVSQTVF